MTSVLFICTGNIFRSLAAEHALRQTAGKLEGFTVTSAGTDGSPKPVPDLVHLELLRRGVDTSGHVPRKLTQTMLDDASLVVAIGIDHQDFVRQNFGLEVALFNEICHQKAESILDLWEVFPNWKSQPIETVEKYTGETIAHIFNSIPAFISRTRIL